jgi:molybdopterin converting factor small subunit
VASVRIELPQVMTHVADGLREFLVEATTISEAFEKIRAEQPKVALHLFDESRCLRPHVLCFLNDSNSRWLDIGTHELTDGDQMIFMQAVSGG